MYINRAIEKTILEIERTFPVVLLTGPRQVGKTTLLQHLSEKSRKYVTLDDPMHRALAISDPGLFLQKFEPPLMIDEVQYAPSLFPYIKMYVDQHKRMGDFWLTGSQIFVMMKNVSESLAGRVGIVQILGLSNNEIMKQPSKPFSMDITELKQKSKLGKKQKIMDLFTRIFTGSMPSLFERNMPLETFFSSYIQSYLQRDIKELTQVGDELTFFKFLIAVAARTSQILNYAEISRDIGVSQPTVKQWLSILIASGMVYLVEPYYNNVLKRSIKSPKVYFLDTGLCSYLTKWTSPESLEAGAMSGSIFETYVVGEIIKSYFNAGKRPPLYFYRDKEQREIDLILFSNDTLFPIEIKKSSNPSKEAIQHFALLNKSGKPIGTGGIICLYDDLVPIDGNNWIIPVGLI